RRGALRPRRRAVRRAAARDRPPAPRGRGGGVARRDTGRGGRPPGAGRVPEPARPGLRLMREPVSPDSSRLRLGVLGVVVLSLFAALLVRLWYLQVMASDQYQAVSTNSVRLVTTEAPRGRILDRNGVELVRNRISDVITVDRNALPMRPDVKARLAFILGISTDELQRRTESKRYSVYKPVPIARDVPKETLIYVREHASDFPGGANTRLTGREATRGGPAAHVLGHTAEMSCGEAAARPGRRGRRTPA